MKTIYILLLLSILNSCHKKTEKNISLSDQKSKITKKAKLKNNKIVSKSEKLKIEPYDFDTILKNNYHLSYRVYKDTIENENLQSFMEKYGNDEDENMNDNIITNIAENIAFETPKNSITSSVKDKMNKLRKR